MGEFLEKVKSKRQSPSAVAHRVALYLNDDSRRALVVESSDDRFFYLAAMRRIKSGKKYEAFSADGKKGATRAIEILNGMNKDGAYAIIDRDFEFDSPDYLFGGRCLVLDVYSFENIFAMGGNISAIGRAFFGIEEGTSELELWNAASASFVSNLPLILRTEHAIAIIALRNSKVCYLSAFNVGKHVSADHNGNISLPDNVCELFVKETSLGLSDREIEGIVQAPELILPTDWLRFFRGHYLIKVLVGFLNSFRRELDVLRQRRGASRSRTRNEISERNVLEGAVPHIELPERLDFFLSKVLA